MDPDNEMKVEIDGTTYIVSSYFTICDETVLDKIIRLVREDEYIIEKAEI